MDRKVCWTNPLAIVLCCGCLPFVYLITTAVVFAVLLVPAMLGFFGVALIASPLIFYHCYRAAILTPRLGIEYKIVLLTFLFIPITLTPFMILILSPFYAMTIAAVSAGSATFHDEDVLFFSAFPAAFESFGDHFSEFKRELLHEFKKKTKRIAEPDHDYDRFTLGLYWLPIAVFSGLFASVIVGTFTLLSFVLKILPITVKLIGQYCYYYWNDCSWFRAMLFLPWLILLLLLPALIPLGGVFLVIAAWIYGLWAFTVPFRYELKGIVWWIYRAVAYVHNESNALIYECKALKMTEPNMGNLARRNYRERIKV